MVKLPVSTSTGRRRSSGTSIQPSRQPVIEKYLLKEPNTMAEREVCQAERRLLCRLDVAVLDAVVDLVAEQPHATRLAPRGDGVELVGRAASCRSGWPGRRSPGRAMGPRSRSSWCTVGWKRVSGPQSISTTLQPRAVSTLRLQG